MRDIVIPNIIYIGTAARRKHLLSVLAFILAIIMYILAGAAIIYNGEFPFLLAVKPKDHDYNKVRSMQFVQIDDKQLNEQTPLNTNLKGKANRISRDATINQQLPQTGPQTKISEPFQAFHEGTPIPSVSSPQAVSQASTPRKEQTAQKPAPALPPVPTKPAVKQQPKPVENTIKAPVIAKIESDAPELKEEKVPGSFFIEPHKPKKPDILTKRPETTDKQPESLKPSEKAKNNQPEKIERVTQPTPEPQQPTRPAQKIAAQKPQPIKIPVRRIGSTNRPQGGKIGFSQKSSAMGLGDRSMAVLRDRYGAYMELLLRRIQEAIIVQQQLSPLFFTQGVVVMNFSINAEGKLSAIHYVQSRPNDMTNESAAARRVLEDVASGKPLPPPTEAMLNDPDFQKITINFVFQQF